MTSACAILSFAACMALSFFSTLFTNRTIFGGGGSVEHKMFALILSTNLPETFLIIRSTERDIVINVHRSSCKAPVILVRF